MQVDSISMLQADLMNAAGPATILMKPGRYDVSEELLIERDVTIQAAIPPSTDGGGVELNGRGINRVLKVVNGHAKLIGIRITGGHATDQGAGIWAQNSDVRLIECSVDNNHVVGDQGMADGGGIYAVGGLLHLSYTRVWNNTAEAVGGGIRVVAPETASQEVPVTFDHVYIGHNRARSDVGGAALGGVDLRMSFVNVSHNTARNSTGGMTVDGTVAIEHLTVQANAAWDGESGGVRFNGPGDVSLTYFDIFGNIAKTGGGLFIDAGEASVRVKDGAIRQNGAEFAGAAAIYSGRVTFERVSVRNNAAAKGIGGIAVNAKNDDRHAPADPEVKLAMCGLRGNINGDLFYGWPHFKVGGVVDVDNFGASASAINFYDETDPSLDFPSYSGFIWNNGVHAVSGQVVNVAGFVCAWQTYIAPGAYIGPVTKCPAQECPEGCEPASEPLHSAATYAEGQVAPNGGRRRLMRRNRRLLFASVPEDHCPEGCAPTQK